MTVSFPAARIAIHTLAVSCYTLAQGSPIQGRFSPERKGCSRQPWKISRNLLGCSREVRIRALLSVVYFSRGTLPQKGVKGQ